MKKCSKCNQFKDKLDFYQNKKNIDGLTSQCKECYKKYYQLNKEEKIEYGKKYSQINKEYINNKRKFKRNKRRKERLQTDTNYKLKCYLRNQLYRVLNNKFKSKSTLELLGCSLEEFKKYFESKFIKGMSWNNYGKWHIDHIKPCASFNLINEEEQKKCFHYTNLQPLWKIDNLRKGKSLNWSKK